MANYSELVRKIYEYVSRKENINSVNHCATRLRITVKDIGKIDQKGLENLPEVLGVVIHNNEIQLIIGTDVPNLYSEFNKYLNNLNDLKENATEKHNKEVKPKKSFKDYFNIAVDFISGTFVPILPVLVAAGLISAVLNIGVTFFGLGTDSGIYIILNAINNAGYYFLPAFLGYSAANKLGISPIMGMFLGLVMVDNSIMGVENLKFLGISVPTPLYNSTTFPVIFGVLFMYFVDKFADKIFHENIKYFLKPLTVMIITVPVTLIVLGPIGNEVGTLIAYVLNIMYEHLNWLSVGIMGALTPLLVMTGTNQALFPLVISNMSELGYDSFVMPAMLAANVSIGAAALAQIKYAKNEDEKGLAISSGITGVMGITEPSIFGILIKYKYALLGAMTGGFVGGLFAGVVQLKQYAIVSPGIAAIPTFIPTDGSGLTINFWYSIITIIISIIIAYVTTNIYYKKFK